MNSIELAEMRIDCIDNQIDSLRKQEVDVSRKIRELNDELAFLKEWVKLMRYVTENMH